MDSKNGGNMKKRVLNSLKKLQGWVCFFVACFLLSFISCDVGLGESVDTQAPTITISYPPISAVIRGSFVLYGNWTDDKGVGLVSVSVVNTSTKETVASTTAVVGIGTWQTTLNSYDSSNSSYYNGWQLPDGTYQVNVTAYDNAGHSSGTSSRTFDIDNTAPVFVISNPGAVKNGASRASAYGSIFTVEGTIADDHDIASMDVTVYDSQGKIVSSETYNGKEIKSFHEDDISTAGGTSVTIAEHGASDSRYNALHPSDEGTEYYTASIKLTDIARAYKNPTGTSPESDLEGNSTYTVYLYDNVYSTLMSSKKGMGLSASDLKNIVNRTVTNENAKTILDAVAISTEGQNDANNLYFSLNPQANPFYTVNGLSYDFDATSTPQTVSAGGTLSITVNAGLDGTLIDVDGSDTGSSSVKVWLKEYDERPSSSGTNTSASVRGEMNSLASSVTNLENSETAFVEYSDATSETPVTEISGWKLLYDYAQNSSGKSSVSTDTFTVTIPEGSVVLGKYYIVCVTGADSDDVVFLQGKALDSQTQDLKDAFYGFEGTEEGVPPTLKIASPVSGAYVKSSDELVFSGTASVSSGSLYVSGLTAVLTVTDQDTNKTFGPFTEKISRSSVDASFAGSSSLACDGNGNWTFTPENLSAYEEIRAAENSKKSYAYTLELAGTSSSGHEATTSSYVQIDSTPPAASVSSISPTVDGSEYDNTENVYVNGAITVKGTVEETNLENVTMQVFVDGKAVPCFKDSDGNDTDTLNLGKTFSFTQTIDTTALEDGKSLDIRITATDKVGNSAAYSSLSASGSAYGKLVILQETDRPKISLGNSSSTTDFETGFSKISEANGNLFGTTTNNKLTATISDDDTITAVVVTVYDKDGRALDEKSVYDGYKANPYTVNPGKSSYSLTYYLPPAEGVYKICIDAYDYLLTDTNNAKEAGHGTTGEYYIAVSAGAPSISVNSYNSYQTEYPSISVATGSSAVNVAAVLTQTKTGKKTNLSVNNSRNAVFQNPLEDGEYSILFTASDLYGQSSSAEAAFTVDVKNPEIKITQYGSTLVKEGLSEAISLDIIPSNTYTVKGSADDEESGVDYVSYYLEGNENSKKTADISTSNGKTLWTAYITEDLLPQRASDKEWDGSKSYTLHVNVTDKAGRTSEDITYITVCPDEIPPVVTISASNLFDGNGNDVIAILDDSSSLTENGQYFAKEKFTISGTIKENRLDYIKVNGKDKREEGETGTGWSYPVDDFEGKKDGTYTYTVQAKDKAGNISETSFTVTKDTTGPQLTVTSPTEASNAGGSAVTVTGTVNDSGIGAKEIGYSIDVTIKDESGSKVQHHFDGKPGEAKEGTFTLDSFTPPAEGICIVSITAEDLLGNKSGTKTVTFYNDVTGPSLTGLEVTTPKKASYSDGGKEYAVYSTAALSVQAYANDEWAPSIASVTAGGTQLSASGNGLYKGSVPVSSQEADGKATLTFTATDSFGNETSENLDGIIIDTTAPALTLSATAATSTSGTATLSGTASDNLRLADKAVVVMSGSEKAAEAQVDENGNWTATITPGKDGQFTYAVYAVDIAGNTSGRQTFIVIFDTSAPTVDSMPSLPIVKLDESSYISFAAKVSDKEKDSFSTGIAHAYYYISESKDSTPSFRAESNEWHEMNRGSGSGSYSATVNLKDDYKITSDSTRYLYIAALDNAGNAAVSETAAIITSDAAAPVISKVEYNSLARSNGDTVLSNNESLTLNVTVSDTNVQSLIPSTTNSEDSPTVKEAGTVTGSDGKETGKKFTVVFKTTTDGKPATLTLTATDKNGRKSADYKISAKCDKTAPAVKIKNPADKAFSKDSPLVVRVSVTEVNYKDTVVSLLSGDKEEYTETASVTQVEKASENETVAEAKFYDVKEGEYTVKAVSTDDYGNKGEDSTTLTYDRTAPATDLNGTGVYISSGEKISALVNNGQYFAKNESFALSGTITERSLKSFTINGATITPATSGSWTYTPEVPSDGANTYKLSLEDTAGNKSEYTLYVTKDSTPPVITLTSPAAGLNTKEGSINIDGNVFDSGSGMKSVSYTLNNATVSKETASSGSLAGLFGDITLPSEGKYTLSVTATDVLGNTSAPSSVEFTYDKSAPSLSGEKVEDAGESYVGEYTDGTTKYKVFKSSSFAVSVNAEDSVTGVASVTANGSAALLNSSTSGNTYTGTVTSFASGTTATVNGNTAGSITLEATDKAGNKESTTIENIIVDSTAPNATITSAAKITNTAFTLSGTASDELGLLDTVVVTDSLDSSKSYSVTPDQNGKWSLALTPGTGADTDLVKYTEDGNHTYTVKATDKAGNSRTVSCEVTVDTAAPLWANNTPPAIANQSVYSKDNINYYRTSEITLNARAEDSTSGLEGLYYKVDSAEEETKADNGSISLASPSLTNGNHTVTINAKDNAGNKTEDTSISFYIDNKAPEISSFSKADTAAGTEDGKANLSLRAVISDTLSGIKTVSLEEGNTAVSEKYTESSGTYTYELKDVATGTHTYRLTVTDNAGNTTTSELTVSVDATKPKVSLSGISPVVTRDSKTCVNGKVTVTGLASDETSLSGANLEIKVYKSDDTAKNDLAAAAGLISEASDGSYTLSGVSKSWNFILDTTKLADKSSYTLELTAKDAAGNTSESESVVINVDQSTDAPGIEVTSSDTAYQTIASLEGKQANILSAGGKITATVTDDDGIDTVTVSYQAENETQWNKSENLLADNAKGRTTANISYTLPAEVTEGGYLIKIDVEDTKGETENAAKSSQFAVAVDNSAPVINLSNTNGNFYNEEIPVSLKVSDASGKVNLKMTGDGSSAKYKDSMPLDSNANETSLSDTITVSSLDDQTSGVGYTATYTATDRWGRTSTVSLQYYVDKTKPSLSSENDEIKSVKGFKNINASWFKDQSLGISGQITESGSGIKAIYYWLTNGENAAANTSDITTASGNFGATYVQGQTYNYSYSTTIGGFETGTNYLTLVAVDNAGNRSSNTLSYTIRIDSTEPEFVENSMKTTVNSTTSAETSLLVNGKYDVTIEGNVKDVNSLINPSRVYVSVGSQKITATGKDLDEIGAAEGTSWQKATVKDTNDNTVKHFSVTVPKDKLGTGTVYLLITDNAENRVNNVSLLNITNDTVPPTIKLSIPSDADTAVPGTQVNGKIKLSGTSNDENGVSAITALEYSKDAGEEKTWTPFSSTTFTGTTSWTSSEIDTTTLDDDTTYYLRAAGKDRAENEGYSNVIELIVSQDSDRPSVKISNLSRQNDNSFILKYGTDAQVTGTISDDDSTSTEVIDTLVISEEAYTGKEESVENLAVLDAATGSFTFTPSDRNDGPKTFYIYIKDNAGKEFYSTATDGTTKYLSNPKLYLKTDRLSDEYASKEFAYKSDGASPSVTNAQSYTYAKGASTRNKTTDASGNQIDEIETVGAAFIAGGENKAQLQFVITANDANGIAGMTLEIKNGNDSVAKYSTSEKINGETITGFTVSNEDSSNGFTTTDDSTPAVWTTGIIDISAYESGSMTLNVTAYDKSGLYGTGTYSFAIDQTPPTIVVSSPLSSEEVTGDTTVQGTALDSGGSATESIYWFIPTQEQISNATSSANEDSYWRGLIKNAASDSANKRGGNALAANSTVSVWKFIFGGSSSTGDSLTNFDDIEFRDQTNQSVFNIPLYLLAEDRLGNYAVEKSYTVKHNPDGDKPVTTITYPDKAESTLGGTIRLSGTVSIPSQTATASALFIQIDSAVGWSKDYISNLTDSSGNKIYEIYTAEKAIKEIVGDEKTSGVNFSSLTYNQLAAYGFRPDKDNDEASLNAAQQLFDSWWGIKANKGSTIWTRNINSNGEFDPAESGTTNKIYIRASGINSDGKIGAWTNNYKINVDNSAPTIGYGLNKFSSISQASDSIDSAAVNAESSASKEYISNMYLKGQWYIVAKVLDESGVSRISVSESGSSSSSYNILTTDSTGTKSLKIPNGYYFETVANETESGKPKNGYKVYIPISQNNGATVTYTLEVEDTDTNSHTSKMEFILNIDNTAPSIDYVNGNGDTLASNGTAAYTKDRRYNVQEKNYVFTPSGKVTDSGSGYERVLFQFVRIGNDVLKEGNEVVIDPMIVSSGSDYSRAKAKIDGSAILAQRVEQDESTSYSLYGKKIAGSFSASTFTPADSTSITDDEHIRVRGVIYIDGLYRTITEKAADGTVSFTPAVTSTEQKTADAFFPYAQVVDNTSTEKVSSQSYSANPLSLSADDGDGMLESISKMGTSWTWDATIHSTNMPDGPATLIVLAFDAAGNVSGTEIPIMVANNAPRIAKLWLATDLNGDGSFTNDKTTSEFEEYSLLEKDAEKALEYAEKDLENKFTAKDKLAVVAEFTGGNGDIKMAYLRNSASTAPVTEANASDFITADSTANTAEGKVSLTSESGSAISGASLKTFFANGSRVNAYILSNKNLTGSESDSEVNDGTGKNFSFTFWDSTEETTCGTNSQNARLAIKNMALDLVDVTAPLVRVNPFYWASSEDNSLYGNSRANGHIELEADLPDETFSKTGEYDKDPKVSGKIVFTGTAYDEHALASITASYGSVTSTASYSKTEKKWTGSGSLETNGYEFTAYDSDLSPAHYPTDTAYFNQKGHKVYWTLVIDTEKAIAETAQADVKLNVLAKDAKGNTTSETDSTKDESDDKYNKPAYKTDVVPYIAGFKTSLSSLKKGNSSVFDRTALGHYPVGSTETIYVYGFNLAGGTLKDSGNGSAGLTLVSDAASQKWYSSSASPAGKVYSVGDISSFTSGLVNVTVNNISSLNNMNSNDSKGGYTTEETIGTTGSAAVYANYYNRQPNGDSNNLLTDDVVLDVWEFRTAAKPVSGKIEQPVMKINPAGDNEIGFAFVSGPLYFSMPGGVDNINYVNQYNTQTATNMSYNYWIASYDFFTSVGLTYDNLGHTYAVAAGGDINENQADHWDLMSSRWGIGTKAQGGSYDGANIRVLESIGLDKNGTKLFDKQRIKSPSLVTTSAQDDSTNLYLAYYDAMNGQIRFRSGKIYNKDSSSTGGFTEASHSRTNPSDSTGSQSRSLIAGGTGNAGKGAGEYVSIGAIEKGGESNDDLVMAVWYDQESRCLWYSYNTKPNSNRGTTNGSGWSTPVQVFTGDLEQAGEYCQLAVDGNNGVHIAAYDPVNCDLVYAYLSAGKKGKAASTGDFSTCVVDSNGVIGSNLTIDVSLDKAGGTPTPRIGYYGTSCIRPKFAYPVGGVSGKTEAGSNEDLFTGKWECSVVPTSSNVNMQSNQYNKMNVGVWKTTDGVASKPSKTGSNSQISSGSGFSSTSYGYAYSNSTGNPVMGYVVKKSATEDEIQTAQMQ